MPESATSPTAFDPEIPGTELSDLWRTIAENLPDNIVAVDRQGLIRWTNRTLPEYERARVIGSNCLDYVTEASKQQHGHLLEAVFRGQTPEPYEVQTLDGRWWLGRGVPVRDQQGEVRAALFISSDITRLKELDSTLQTRQKLLERVQDTSPAITFIIDLRQSRLLYVTESLVPMLGFSAEELLEVGGEIIEFLVHPDEVTATRAALATLGQTKNEELTMLTIRCRNRDGGWRWMHLRAAPFDRDPNGVPITAVGAAIDVNETKEAQQRLAEQSELFRLIADTSPAVVFIYDHVAQRMAYVNSRVEELLGYSAAEMMSMHGDLQSRIVHPNDVEHVANHIAWLAQQGDEVIGEMEYRVLRRDGTHRWVATRSTIFKRLPDGGLHQTLDSTVDVTDRRLASEALAEQRQLLTHIIQTSPAVTFVWDLAADRAVYVNGRAEELLGIDATEFLIPGESLRDRWLHPAERETVAGLLVRLVTADDDEVFDVEHRMLHRDGSWRWVHNRAAVFQRDAAGKVTHTIGLLFDVTNRRLAEQALAQSEASLRSVMRYAPDLIAKLDKHGRITYANQFNIRGDGCMLSETHATAWVISEDTRRLQAALSKVFIERETTRTEIRVHRLDGAERVYDCRFGPIVVHEAIESAIVIARDVTEERCDAEMLRMRDAQLAHASRLTVSGGMLAGIAHEVNQPLYAISNFAAASLQLLRDDNSPRADTVCQWLARITEQADRAAGIVRRLREFVGKGQQIREPHDLNAVLRDSLRFVEPMSKAARIRVQAALSDEPLAASVDRLQIEQVLVNLLQNAVDSMEQCQVADRNLLAGLSREHGEAHISIMDRGAGVPVEDLERVFDPFFTTKPDGLGLGLAISRNIVSAHGGRIWITRNVGVGSTFHVTLPLVGEPGHES